MMTPTNTVSPEWHNENTLRSYPLRDDCPAADRLPTWLIADIRVTVDSGYSSVFVSSTYVSDTLVSVGISGMRDGRQVGLLARAVPRDGLHPGRVWSFERIADGLASGTIVFGTPPEGAERFSFRFTADEAPLAVSAVVRTAAPGVTRVVDAVHGTCASGIIDLSGNHEFRTSRDPHDPQCIVVTLADLYRDLSTSVCTATPSYEKCGMTPVKTICGVAPDENGIITLRFR